MTGRHNDRPRKRIARLCARHASDMEVEELVELVKTERQLTGDYEALAQHNQRFHENICGSVLNKVFKSF